MKHQTREVIIHIGYPKTATTTLQASLFPFLHERGRFFYLGKWVDDKDDGESSKNCTYYNIVKRIFWGGGKNTVTLPHIGEKTIVISDEAFTVPRNLMFGATSKYKDEDLYYIPRALGEIFGESTVEIKILVTLRNQKEMIPSFYTELVSDFKDLLDATSLDGVIELATQDNNSYKMWEYSKVLDTYSEVYGEDSVEVLLYEDLLYNKTLFYKRLADIFDEDVQTMGYYIGATRYNTKITLDTGKMMRHSKNSWLHSKFVIVSGIINRFGLASRLIRIWSRSCLRRYYLKLMYVDTVVPHATEAQKERIFNHYRESNLKLVGKYGLEEEKLKRYGYI